MNIIKNIITFVKNIFIKEEKTKMLEKSIEKTNIEKQEFINSIKVNNKKQEVETLICYGDGLGIQNKISC